MPSGLKGRGSGPGANYLLLDLQSESLVSTCKSFCSHLISVYYTFYQKIVSKKPQNNPTIKNNKQFMPLPLTFFLKSLLMSMDPFEDVFCCGPEQQQPGEGAAGMLSWAAAARYGSEHEAEQRHQTPTCCCCRSPQKIQAWFATVLGSVYPAAFTAPAQRFIITGRFLPCPNLMVFLP